MIPWTTRLKKISLSSTVGYTPSDAAVTGKKPSLTNIEFSSLELFGAAARCSHLHLVNPEVASVEGDMMAKFIGPHVDNDVEGFSIELTADRFKDFVKSFFTGTVAAGIAYLAMVKQGYTWADHYENIKGGNPYAERSPDFVFESTDGSVALVEAKGSRASRLSKFHQTLKEGYIDQIAPHLGYTIGGNKATHGFCVGSHMKAGRTAELHIHYTEPQLAKSIVAPELVSPKKVQQGNFATAFSLAHSPGLGADVRAGEVADDKTFFVRFEWLGRRWLTSLTFDPRFLESIDLAYKKRAVPLPKLQRYWPTGLRLIFAIEEKVAASALGKFLSRSPQFTSDEPLMLLDRDFYESATNTREEDVAAIFPDGLALIDLGRINPKFQIVHWNSAQGKLVPQ